MGNKNSDNVIIVSKNSPVSSNPYEILETIGDRNFKAAVRSEVGTPLAFYDAICISGAETGEHTGDALGINATKWIEATTTAGETIQLRQIKFKIIDGAGSLSPAGWTSQLLSPADSHLSAFEKNMHLTLHPWAYSENVQTANQPIRYGDVVKVYKAGGCYFYRSIADRGMQFGIENYMNSSLTDKEDSTSGAFGTAGGGPNNTLYTFGQKSTAEINDEATRLFEQALKTEFTKQGLTFRVTSRRRSSESQAKLIVQKWEKHGPKEVEKNYPRSYEALKRFKAIEKSYGKDSATYKSAWNAFKLTVTSSSAHLDGRALDIRTKKYNEKEMRKAIAAVKACGGKPYLEPTKTDCWEKPGRNPSPKRTPGVTPAKGVCYAEHIHCNVPDSYIEQARMDDIMGADLANITW